MNKCSLVRSSSSLIVSQSNYIKLNEENLAKLAFQIPSSIPYIPFESFDCHLEPSKHPLSLIIDYIFVLDSLNFCFWPSDWEYDNLARSLKKLALNDQECFKPKNMRNWTLEYVRKNIFEDKDFPLIDERLRILKEVSEVAIACFDGEFENVFKRANNSAVHFVYLLTSHFNNFQDISIYNGHQVCFYKRSQILVADLWGALKDLPEHKNLFPDIDELTTFPDYRVPQILNQLNVLEYSEELTNIIESKKEIKAGCQIELEIRAFTVLAVERLKEEVRKRGQKMNSVEIDWFLWQTGEKVKDNIKNHHRTLTIYY